MMIFVSICLFMRRLVAVFPLLRSAPLFSLSVCLSFLVRVRVRAFHRHRLAYHQQRCCCSSTSSSHYLLSYSSRSSVNSLQMCQVTRSNFEQLFPEIRAAIDRSLFLAIDTEFSTLETFFPQTENAIRTRDAFYRQRRHLVEQLTVFQFGLAIFSSNPEGKRYDVQIYNFSLHPPAIEPLDGKFVVQSSSIEFLTEYQFDFNRCFYDGISFVNQSQEKLLHNLHSSPGRYSISDQTFFDELFEHINQWLTHAELHQTMLYDLPAKKHRRLPPYLLQLEIRRCFQSVWTTIDDRQRLCIERISKETYDERMRETTNEHNDDFQRFQQAIVGFTRLIRSIVETYRQPIVGKTPREFTGHNHLDMHRSDQFDFFRT